MILLDNYETMFSLENTPLSPSSEMTICGDKLKMSPFRFQLQDQIFGLLIIMQIMKINACQKLCLVSFKSVNVITKAVRALLWKTKLA